MQGLYTDLTQLNTSMLGRTILNTSKSASPLLSTIEGHIEGDINGAIADFAKELNIHDFYSGKPNTIDPKVPSKLTTGDL